MPDKLADILNRHPNKTMVRLHEIAKLAIKEDHVVEWLTSRNDSLPNSITPLEACFTDEGYDRVEYLLISIIQGFPA